MTAQDLDLQAQAPTHATLDDKDVPNPGEYAADTQAADTHGADDASQALGERSPGHDSPGGYPTTADRDRPGRDDAQAASPSHRVAYRDDHPDSDYGGQGDWTRSAQGRSYRGGPSQEHQAPLEGGRSAPGGDCDGGSPPGGSAQRGYYGGSEGSNVQGNGYEASGQPTGPGWGSEQLPPGTGRGGSPEWRSEPDSPSPRREGQGGGHDPHHTHYRQWRDDHLRSLDDDYREFRRERAARFEEEFTAWRQGRQSRASLGEGAVQDGARRAPGPTSSQQTGPHSGTASAPSAGR